MRDKICQYAPEHANLVHDMIPVSGSLELLRQQPEQLLAHIDDTARHGTDIALPVGEQLGIVQDQRNLQRRKMSAIAMCERRCEVVE